MDNHTSETVTIPLSRGQETIVDKIDADLAEIKWHALPCAHDLDDGKFRAARNLPRVNGKRGHELMHRVILSRMLGRPLLPSEEVDHVHGNPLDNRRSELRLATRSQNNQNKGKRSDSTSSFKGVSREKGRNRWRAVIRVNGKQIHLGCFDTPEAAYEAYCKAATSLHGEFART